MQQNFTEMKHDLTKQPKTLGGKPSIQKNRVEFQILNIFSYFLLTNLGLIFFLKVISLIKSLIWAILEPTDKIFLILQFYMMHSILTYHHHICWNVAFCVLLPKIPSNANWFGSNKFSQALQGLGSYMKSSSRILAHCQEKRCWLY